MKDLQTLVAESLINEASQYKPKFKPQDWAKALKELNKGAYGNYSQLCNMEGLCLMDDYETVDAWVEELYDDGKFDPKYEFKDIVTDIANFLAENYEKSDADYGDSQDTIYYWKRDMTDCDFGVEEENWYKFYKYTGPSSMKKYAKEIAKVGDCSYMDDMDELAEYYETNNKRKKKKAEKKETPEEVAARQAEARASLKANFYASFKTKEEFMEYVRNSYIPPTIDRKEYMKYEEEQYMKYRSSSK